MTYLCKERGMAFLFFLFVSQITQISAFAGPACHRSSRTNSKAFSKGLCCEAELLWELPSFWKELKSQYGSLGGGIHGVSPLSLVI